MNKIKNSIIIIHDYEYETIKKIQEEANTFWTNYFVNNAGVSSSIVSPVICSVFNKEYTVMVTGDCAHVGDLSIEFNKDRLSWCDFIYKNYLPQNIIVINVSDCEESYIEYQLPKIEVYNNGKNTDK